MADKKYTIEMVAKGLNEVVAELKQVNSELNKTEKLQDKGSKAQRRYNKSQGETEKKLKGVGGATNNTTHAFSKMARDMEGTLVPAYATVAANVFALTAAFGALERAADFSILVDSSRALAEQTGRSLTQLAASMQEVTGNAITMKEALSSASIATSAGFDNSTIEELTQVARNASVALGREMTDSLNRVFKGAIKAEPELLDELGIILRLDTAARKYAATLGKSANELTTFEKQQAVVNDVIEQGQDKFGRLSEIDPNPYTQLSAAFRDITTELVNFINTPLGSVIGFFTENTTALSAAILLFATRIAKFAFPALQNFTELMDAKLVNSLGKIDRAINKLNKNEINLISKETLSRTEDIVDEFIGISAKGFKDLGKTPGQGFINLTNIDDAETKLRQFLKVYKGAEKQLKNKAELGITASAVGIENTTAGLARLRTMIELVEKQLVELNRTSRTDLFEGALKSVNSMSRAVLGLTRDILTYNVATIKAVNESTTGFGGLYTAMRKVISQTRGLRRVAAVSTSALTGLGAVAFKLGPQVLAAVFAFQLLSSAVESVYNFLTDAPDIDFNKTLEDSARTLDDVTAATIRYQNVLEGAPRSIDNLTESINSQANSLQELRSILEKTTGDLQELKSFDFFDEVFDIFGFGQIEGLEEQTERILESLERLGNAEELGNILQRFGLEDIDEVSTLSSQELIKFNEALSNSVEGLNKVAQDSKAAIESINTGIEELNKSLVETINSLGKLTSEQKGFLAFEKLAEEFKFVFSDVLTVTTSLNKLGTESLISLGLDEEITNVIGLTNSLEDLSKEREIAIKKIEEAKEAFGFSGLKKAREGLERINIAIDTTNKQLSKISGPITEALEAAGNDLSKLNKAQEVFNDNSQKAKLTSLIDPRDTKEYIDRIHEGVQLEKDLIAAQNILINKQLDNARESEERARARLRNIEAEVLEKEKIGDTEGLRKLSNEASQQINLLSAAKTTILKAEKALEAGINKNIENSFDAISKLQKEFNSLTPFLAAGVDTFTPRLKEIRKAISREFANIRLGVDDEEVEAIVDRVEKAFERNTILEGIQKTRNIPALESIKKDILAVADESLELTFNTVDLELPTLLSESKNEIRDLIVSQNELNRLQKVQFDNEAFFKNAEKRAEIALKISAQQELIDQKKILLVQKATKLAKDRTDELRVENEELKDQLAFGAKLNKQDLQALKLAKIKDSLSAADRTTRKRLLLEQEINNAYINRLDYLNQLDSAAESMNDLADAMNRFAENSQNVEFDQMANGLQLLQSVSSTIDNHLGNFSKGIATLGLALTNYNETITDIRANENTSDVIKNLKEEQALYGLIANAAGALAGSFRENTKAAKAFTLVQQGVAIASAAAAVTTAITKSSGNAISAFVTGTAMLSFVSSVLGAAGIAFGGTSVSGENAEQNYNDRIGDDRLLDRDLQSNALTDSIDNLISVDTILGSEVHDLQQEISQLNQLFSKIGAQVFTGVRGGRLRQDFGLISTAVSFELTDLQQDFANLLGSAFTLGLGGDFVEDLANSLFGSTTTSSEILDFGINFSASVELAGNSLEAAFSELQQFTTLLVTTTKERVFGLSSDTSTSVQTRYSNLPEDLVSALTKGLQDTVSVTEKLLKEFLGGTATIRGADIKSQSLSLEGLSAEESAEAIALFFSTVSNDIIASSVPYIESFSNAGEELIDTLIRLTAESIVLKNSFSSAGIDLDSLLGFANISGSDVYKRVSLNIVEAFERGLVNEDTYEALRFQGQYMYTLYNTAILDGLSQAEREALGIIGSRVYDSTYTLLTQHPDMIERTYFELFQTADQVISNIAELWKDRLKSSFLNIEGVFDAERFSDIFSKFNSIINTEEEKLSIGIANLSSSIVSSFQKLGDTLGLDAIGIVNNSEDFNAAFNELFNTVINQGLLDVEQYTQSEAANIATQLGSTVEELFAEFDNIYYDISGGDTLADLIELGSVIFDFQELEESISNLQDPIEKLNERYRRQIALFGLVGKELDLLSLSFDYEDAIKEAVETGSDLSLVETAFGLERLDIVRSYNQDILDSIESSQSSIADSILDITRNLTNWDEVIYQSIKIDRIARKLGDSLTGVDFSSLFLTDDFSDFEQEFANVIGNINPQDPEGIEDQINLVNSLKEATLARYSAEVSAIENLADTFEDLIIDIQDYLDELLIGDLSPLTNFERLQEAQSQFDQNIADIFSDDPELIARASDNLIASADSLLDQASLFYSIGPEYKAIFDSVTSQLEGLGLDLSDTTNPQLDAIQAIEQATIQQLSFLDGILLELEEINTSNLNNEIASMTDVLEPAITGISTKLQQLNDSTWTPIKNALLFAFPGNSFDVGTPFVNRNQMAMIHKGESIIPESFASGIRSGSITLGQAPDNSEIVNAIKELTLVLAESQEDIANITAKSVDVSTSIANNIANANKTKTNRVA